MGRIMLLHSAALVATSGHDKAMVVLALVAALGIVIALGVFGGRLAWRWHDRREAKRTAEMKSVLQRFSYSWVTGVSPIDVSFGFRGG